MKKIVIPNNYNNRLQYECPFGCGLKTRLKGTLVHNHLSKCPSKPLGRVETLRIIAKGIMPLNDKKEMLRRLIIKSNDRNTLQDNGGSVRDD